MSEQSLMRYYSRLLPLGVGEEIKTSLFEVSERLFTSTRHARTLLNKMHLQGWLIWQPKAGRSQRSSLFLQLEPGELKSQLATEQIALGQYEKALQFLDGDQALFGQLLQNTSGATIREGLLHIQLTYKRSFEQLVPHHLHRSSERFFIRQLYSCLVSSNNDGELEGQLAHHWVHNGLQWRFYLRPGLTFHNGQPITAESIAALFSKLQTLDAYKHDLSHVESVIAPTSHQVLFTLSQRDNGFGGLLSDVRYSIQPPSQINGSNANRIVGSGPFMLLEHNEEQLKLEAFERYFGNRALPDQVTVWPVAESNDGQCEYHVSQVCSNNSQKGTKHSQVEYGCIFLLFNQRPNSESVNKLNEQQRRYLTTLLAPLALKQYTDNTAFGGVPAGNMLPVWKKIVRPSAPHVPLPKKISISIYRYSALDICATAAASILEKLGVEVTINRYTYRQLMQSDKLEEDLIITNINLDDNRHASAFGHLWANPILHGYLSTTASQWLKTELSKLRNDTPLNQYLVQLEPIASTLVTEYWLTPLFHHQQTLRFHGVLKNVALTNWGWPDLRNVWSAEE
ncbi:SgrR family transcriptional regulator [Vibrio tapetis subsp. quintayensis]|uniref:SgrR family transcriptional regulator n=1 Tax=Vibrio tapetis TaxID=52443 RepID=UPI0025B3D210|nr:SgrR family transcriptional regulator [Vibrio tapetis]MDN3680840.1 SgrR family transcriptional regulator [Vibrio tapetis subsp. quintayensis]